MKDTRSESLPELTLRNSQWRQPIKQAWQSRVPGEHEHSGERDPHRCQSEAEELRCLRVSQQPFMRVVPA